MPVGVISAAYLSAYKTSYDENERGVLANIEIHGNNDGEIDALNLKKVSYKIEDYKLQKEKYVYKAFYDDAYNSAKSEYDDDFESIKSNVTSDYNETGEMFLNRYDKYIDYEAYDVITNKYEEVFNKYKKEQQHKQRMLLIKNICLGIGGAIFVILTIFIISRFIHKKTPTNKQEL